MMKSIVMIIMVLLMIPMVSVANTSLNDVVKEARRSGQVLSAKTREGVHEVRVMTPQGTIRTVRESAGRVVGQPDTRQQRPETYNNPYLQQPSRYQAEPRNEAQNNRQNSRQEPRQSSQQSAAQQTQRPQSRPPQPRRSQSSPTRRQTNDRQPEPKDPD